MIGRIIWCTAMLLTTLTFVIRAMQGFPIATVFYETNEVILIEKENDIEKDSL